MIIDKWTHVDASLPLKNEKESKMGKEEEGIIIDYQ